MRFLILVPVVIAFVVLITAETFRQIGFGSAILLGSLAFITLAAHMRPSQDDTSWW